MLANRRRVARRNDPKPESHPASNASPASTAAISIARLIVALLLAGRAADIDATRLVMAYSGYHRLGLPY